ncbi:MAG TPA: nitrile hydratase subunit alpha [Rhizomicrobium sp.]|jgi:nitrile hydratase|nr:nitrile hydratase subunit alpha [Rhizomicrobium sp.]
MNDIPAPPAARAAALKEAFAEKGLLPDGFVEDFTRHGEENWISRNGARMVARAWTDGAFRARLLADATAAALEMGFELPKHHRRLVALENSPGIHNVIVCTQCSCTAFTIIGGAPDWYKDLDYRARVVRQARSVLEEMGLALPAATEIRVWDTSADSRYMVLPLQPERTKGWDAEALAAIVTQDAMIGVAEVR